MLELWSRGTEGDNKEIFLHCKLTIFFFHFGLHLLVILNKMWPADLVQKYCFYKELHFINEWHLLVCAAPSALISCSFDKTSQYLPTCTISTSACWFTILKTGLNVSHMSTKHPIIWFCCFKKAAIYEKCEWQTLVFAPPLSIPFTGTWHSAQRKR